MLFSSWQFILIFLPVTAGIFFALPARFRSARKWWLFAASIAFYCYWKPEYVFLLLLSIGVNYALAEGCVRSRNRRVGAWLIGTGVVLNLLLLGYFKYANFALHNLGLITGHDFARFNTVLPLAISFFTFTQIAYLVDTWRDPKVHSKPADYALFVVFFPHLIAGPIVRHWEIIPQYADRDLRPTRTDWGVGLAFFISGLIKKLLFADTVAQCANAVFDAAARGQPLNWFDSWLGVLAFAVQLYFDFSGYSDMAVGLARLFGIKFPYNFDSPYQARSIIDFWQRWHITLTRFFREYVYIPLGGNRVGPLRQALNVAATFLLSGLWHGAGWTYVVWGGIHGLALIVVHRWRVFRKGLAWAPPGRFANAASWAATFWVATIAWVFFRAPSLRIAGKMLASMFGFGGLTISNEATNPERFPGVVLSRLGMRFVHGVEGMPDYSDTIRWLLLLLAIAWFAPNSQHLLSRYESTPDQTVRPARFRLLLDARIGFALGVALFFAIRSRYSTGESPFLYFNF